MPTTPPLTRRQRQIVDFLRQYAGEHGISPTLEEIASHFGVNKVTIFGHVAELERKGISTVVIQLLRKVAERVGPPRALLVPFRHGYPLDDDGIFGPVTD